MEMLERCGLHVFIVQPDFEVILSRPLKIGWTDRSVGHIDLAQGKPIIFGGEIKFSGAYRGRGAIRWWNDRTGHYHDLNRPMDPGVITQLPLDLFRPFDWG